MKSVTLMIPDGTDKHALRDIDDAREITAFEHILNIIGHTGLESCK